MKKSTRKGQTPKLQVIDKDLAAIQSQPLLMANPQAALPLLSMIGQAQLSIEDLLGQMSRQFVEQLLMMAAESVVTQAPRSADGARALARRPGRHGQSGPLQTEDYPTQTAWTGR